MTLYVAAYDTETPACLAACRKIVDVHRRYAMPATFFLTGGEEEFAVNNKPFIDRAVAEQAPYVTLIWHPWSLDRFDPQMRMLEVTFRYVRERGLPTGRFADILTRLAAQA